MNKKDKEMKNPCSFVVGGYVPKPCSKLLSLRLRDTPDTRRLLEQLASRPTGRACAWRLDDAVCGGRMGGRWI
jgi:hypothetical protein